MHIFRTPFLFLLVSYPRSGVISWAIPVVLSTATMVVFYYLPGEISLSGDDGFLERVITIMTISGGFFVTSLTVILTNESDIINSTFIGEGKPKIVGENELLTRKRFLSLLFGYISFISFVVVGVVSVALVASNSLKMTFSENVLDILEYGSGFVLLIFLFQIFLFSMVGLHYLTDRLHRSDGRSRFSKPIPEIEASSDVE